MALNLIKMTLHPYDVLYPFCKFVTENVYAQQIKFRFSLVSLNNKVNRPIMQLDGNIICRCSYVGFLR